ncbi:MAG: hypothetical protein KatS3mg021_1824 [Fimbriimonadales bacterium]|nr:MAG: hypothetical protein KatS3mg021_1824 [Fimbriimonadales bacterium]CUU35366.1 RHS repeat-associated core domain-containing protein [Armatimonadetes bacterium GXS]
MPNLPPSRAKNAGICLYDGDALVAEIDPWGNGLAEYVWGQLGPVARMERSGLYGYRVLLYVCDALGHVRMLIDASTGQVTDRYAYDAWGNLIAREGSTRQPFLWNGAYGYEWDCFGGMGLYHVGTRAYDPRTARWLQRDPIDAASGDPNLYRYCGNDPINHADPSGLWATGSYIGDVGQVFAGYGYCLWGLLTSPINLYSYFQQHGLSLDSPWNLLKQGVSSWWR